MKTNARFQICLLGVGLLLLPATLPAQLIITTVAGGVGNGGAATNASLEYPFGVAVDASGNLFIADCYNDSIRKVNVNGIITTVAGMGWGGYSGDGGAATNATLNIPEGVAVDASGNLFIADACNNVIRKVNVRGVITTVAGNGYGAPYIGGYSGDGGAATNAKLGYPRGVVVDASGNLFIVDSANCRIRKVGTNGIIATFAGGGFGLGDGGSATNAELDITGLAVDATGNLFIADYYNGRIRKVNVNGIITTVAGGGMGGYYGDGGAATNASLNLTISGVAVDTSGNLFFSDGHIRKVDVNGIITSVVGVEGSYAYGFGGDGGAATNAFLDEPAGIAVDTSGNLFIADSDNDRIRKVSTNGIITTVAGNGTTSISDVGPAVGGPVTGYFSGDGGAATSASLDSPFGVAVDVSGNLFIADSDNNRIRKVNVNGIITTVAGGGSSILGDGGAATNAGLYGPGGVAVDASGNLFIADGGDNVIRKVNVSGIITTVAGNGYGAPYDNRGYSGDGGAATNAGLYGPYGVAVDASGNLFIADSGNGRIRKVGTNGIITTVAGGGSNGLGDGGSATNAELDPSGVAVDAAGNLFIADQGNQRIRKVNVNGIITTVAGGGTNGWLYWPFGVAVDASGNLFIADSGLNNIRKVDINGIITTVAGSGYESPITDFPGYMGDGGAATNAGLYDPAGVAVDASGNLFIADTGDNRVREVASVGIPAQSGSFEVTTLALPNGTNGTTYSQTLTASGGQTPYTWTISAGALPPGLTLATNWVISGTPTNIGTFHFTVKVTDALAAVATQPLTLTVMGLSTVILSAPQVTVGKTNFTFQLSGPAGNNYVLQTSTNLLNWSSVSTSSIPVSGTTNLSNAISNYNRSFYRVHLQ